MSNEKSDLLARARSGDASALQKLLELDRTYLELIAFSELDSDLKTKVSPSDVVQESIVEAQQAFTDFQGTKTGQWRNWLHTILNNNLKDVRRKFVGAQKRNINREVRGNEGELAIPGSAPSPESDFFRQEQFRQLTSQIEKLPDHYRRVLHLRYWQQMPYEEMAKELNSTSEAVRKLLYRAVEGLPDAFPEKDDN